MTSCHEPSSAFKSLCSLPSTISTSFDVTSPYSSAFHLPVIHPALLSNTHLLHLNTYNPNIYDSSSDRIFEHNNNSEKAESSCSSSRDSNHDSSSPTSTGGSCSRDNVIVRNNEIKRKKGQVKDEAYWERRRKNNDAAKKSRDQRRQKEDEMACRAANLEQENMRLRVELDQLRAETDQLRTLILTPSTSFNLPLSHSRLLATVAAVAQHPPQPAPSVITTSQVFAPLTPVQIPKTPPPPPSSTSSSSIHRTSVLVSNPTMIIKS